MKLQDYKDGEIHRNGGEFSYRVNGKVKSTYSSLQDLVDAQSDSKETTRKSNSKRSGVVDQDDIEDAQVKAADPTDTPSS